MYSTLLHVLIAVICMVSVLPIKMFLNLPSTLVMSSAIADASKTEQEERAL